MRANVEHHNVKEIVLNTAQMRNHSFIQQFCVDPVQINQDTAIVTGAAREIAVQQAKSHRQNTTQAGNSMLQAVVDPLQAGVSSIGARGGRGLRLRQGKLRRR